MFRLDFSIVALGLVGPAMGLTPEQTLYPLMLNDTSYIANSSIGNYGGIYEAPTFGPTEGTPYGSFDYYAMPHPRAQEYQLPAAAGGKGKLVCLEYLQRHQRRTPYNILPGGENQAYYCDNVRPYLYGGPATNRGIRVNGTRQYPQITIGDVQDGYQHGLDLWEVYGEKLSLIPSEPNGRVWFRSSESPLTQASAGAVLRGIWPDYQGALPLRQMVSSVDTVNEGYSCSAIDSTLSNLTSTAEWEQHLAATEELRSTLATKLGPEEATGRAAASGEGGHGDWPRRWGRGVAGDGRVLTPSPSRPAPFLRGSTADTINEAF